MGIEQSLDRFQEMKRDRIAFMVSELLEMGGKADIEKLKGSLAVNYGLRGSTQDEYLEDLAKAGMIYVVKNEVMLKWKEEDARKWLEKQGKIPTPKKERT